MYWLYLYPSATGNQPSMRVYKRFEGYGCVCGDTINRNELKFYYAIFPKRAEKVGAGIFYGFRM